jgi:signal transduction histidine kinase
MELNRRTTLIYGLLALVWLLVLGWQVEEHIRFESYGKNALRNRSRAIANTLGASIRGLQFRGRVAGDRLQPVLDEMVYGQTNDAVFPSEVIAILLLNAKGESVASAGRPIDLEQQDIVQEGERWGNTTATFVYPIEGASVSSEGNTNASPPVLLPPFTNSFREGRPFSRRDDHPEALSRSANPGSETNPPAASNSPSSAAEGERPSRFQPRGESESSSAAASSNAPAPPDRRREADGRPRRPFWARGMSDQEFQSMLEKRELHGVVLRMAVEPLEAAALHDLWLRSIVVFFAAISALGSGIAWRGLAKSSELQIRLIRASELNTHLKDMNLAAAGLAHETRNPLNIIRGIAQMISRQPDASSDVRSKSAEIINEADKVAAQLNEFINYSKPREVRRTSLALRPVVNEIARALSYDLEEKKVQLEIGGEDLKIEADDQLLRQALFNLILNAIQAVDGDGKIEVSASRQGPSEAVIEIRDNGPGVKSENREDIFKPYFTTQKTGTGLGLAVVQQIVLVHGWEITCANNEPRGAIFRISHVKTR